MIINLCLDENTAIFTQGIKFHRKQTHEITELIVIFQLLNSIIFHRGDMCYLGTLRTLFLVQTQSLSAF